LIEGEREREEQNVSKDDFKTGRECVQTAEDDEEEQVWTMQRDQKTLRFVE
jgi:hypothetical protein